MESTNSNEISRRRLLALGGPSTGAALLGPGLAYLNPYGNAAAAPGSPAATCNTSFASLKQIDAGLLNVGYAEDGPADGPAVILLQGWPYDIYSYVDVAPLLAAKGYRVIVPFLRGYGTTRFLSADTFRNGQPLLHRPRHRQSHGCSQDSKSNPCRL
ncbi:MAG: alpha/beta fold hydrolase [Terracidiphilus sp.]